MKTKRTNTDAFAKFNAVLILSPLLAVVLTKCVTSAAELEGVMDQGVLTLSWDVPEAKLEQARGPHGPWQTVLATGSPYRLRPSTNLASRCGFYRLKMPAPGKKWLTVAAVTMNPNSDVAINLETFFSYMGRAASNSVDLVVFPEIALQECPAWGLTSHTPTPEEMEYIWQTAETIPGPSTASLVEKAAELNLFVVFGMTEQDQNNLYNANVFLGPDGILGKHRKRYFLDASFGGNEDQIWVPGQSWDVVNSSLGKVGLLIGWEMSFSPGPVLAGQGATLLVTSSAWYSGWPGFYEQYTVTNAVQAQRRHVVSDKVGDYGDLTTLGRSRVVDPQGRVVCDTGPSQGMVIWATDILTDIRMPP